MAYVPSSTKDLKEVMYFPTDPGPEEKEVLIKILDHYIGRSESTDN